MDKITIEADDGLMESWDLFSCFFLIFAAICVITLILQVIGVL